MDQETARELIALNNAFYAQVGASFSQTRQSAWPGWEQVTEMALGRFSDSETPGLSVFDLACGNLRFEAFASKALAELAPLKFYAIDGSAELAQSGQFDLEGHSIDFHQVDILSTLLAGGHLSDAIPANENLRADVSGNPALTKSPEAGTFDVDSLGANPCDANGERESLSNASPTCDLSVCFGFMHHVPTVELRALVVRELLRHTRPGGLVAISFWNFMAVERMAKKVAAAEEHALENPPFSSYDPDKLDPHDHLIGWQESNALRYCHNFDNLEIDKALARVLRLSDCPDFDEIRRFRADGKSGAMNIYTILERF